MIRRLLLLTGLIIVTSFYVSAQPGQVLKYLSRHTQLPAALDGAAAEVVAYDTASKRAIFTDANANKITFVDLTNPNAPTKLFDVILSAYNGSPNSVAVRNGIVAVALEDAFKQNPGKVLFFDINGAFLSLVGVGALPDMLTFTPDGKKVIVCNEGEPNDDYTIDPPGSVSIIDVTNPAAPIAQTVFFNALDAKKDSLMALGVRIFGPNATVSQDLEPEYVGITPDGKTAYVTLQEANAFAIIDIATASLTRIVPLGYKDHLRGQPTLKQFEWRNRPLLGTTDMGQDVLLGGFSGLWYEGVDPLNSNKLIFLTHPDRGPNGEPSLVDGELRRPFVLPDFQCEVVRFSLDKTTGQFSVLNRIPLYRGDNIPISGLPNLQAAAQNIAFTDEIPCDLYGEVLDNDPFGADPEGIVVDGSGDWWIVDEYRPAIYHFKNTGEMVNRYVSVGTAASVGAANGTYGVEALPRVYAQRWPNRGFEAVAIDGDILYAFIQSPLDNPDTPQNTVSRTSGWCRILAFNVVTKQVVGEYLYPLFEQDRGVDKIGDAVRVGPGKFMVVERDSRVGPKAFKYIYDINLKGATNLITNPPVLQPGETLEALTFAQIVAKGVKPVHKTKSVFLSGLGYVAGDKVEGLAMIDSKTIAVINDNDFGVGAATLPDPPTGMIALDPNAIPVVGLISFSGGGLDGSDKDNAVNIANWPVRGIYMPDAAKVITVAGENYIVTANEGDTRAYDGFDEETSIAGVTIDPALLSAWPTLQTNSGIGRLGITNTMGDLDGDGDYDELYAIGARSFSVWNSDGNLIYDSGDEFEQRTAGFYPATFNASNTNNSFDNRSDNKGPEPESIETATINGKTYAFIGLERIGHTFMFDVTNPYKPVYTDYLNTRNFNVAVDNANITNGTLGDLAPETQYFVPHAKSGNGGALLVSANEVSGTLSVYAVRIPEIVSSPATTRNVCINDDLVLQVNARGANLSYQWARNGVDIPLATTNTYAVVVTGPAQAGTYTCRVNEDGGQTVTPPATVVSVYKRTRIDSQPQPLTQMFSNEIRRIGVKATDESNETFQWYKDNVMLNDNNTFSGTKTDTLTITWPTFADTSSKYYCVVTGGCSTVQSNYAAVLIPEIKITSEPTDQIICPGDTATFRVAAIYSGGDTRVDYQWKLYQGGNVENNSHISGAQSPTLTIRNASLDDAGQYICVVTGTPSGVDRVSKVVRLVVAEDPIIRQQPDDILGSTSVALCDEGSVGLRILVDGVDLHYVWFKDGAALSNTDSPSLDVSQPGVYWCVTRGACSQTDVRSNSITVTTKNRPVIGLDVPSQITARIGDAFNISFTLTAGSPTLSYQWFRNAFIIPGATQERYSVNSAVRRDAGEYRCQIMNDCGVIITGVCLVIIEDPVSVQEELESQLGLSVEPQPFTSTAMAHFSIPSAGAVRISLVDMNGRLATVVADDMFSEGPHQVSFNADQLGASGTYLLRVEYAGGFVTKPVVLVK